MPRFILMSALLASFFSASLSYAGCGVSKPGFGHAYIILNPGTDSQVNLGACVSSDVGYCYREVIPLMPECRENKPNNDNAPMGPVVRAPAAVVQVVTSGLAAAKTAGDPPRSKSLDPKVVAEERDVLVKKIGSRAVALMNDGEVDEHYHQVVATAAAK